MESQSTIQTSVLYRILQFTPQEYNTKLIDPIGQLYCIHKCLTETNGTSLKTYQSFRRFQILSNTFIIVHINDWIET